MSQECAPFGPYNFDNVALTIDGARVTGFGDGDDVIMIERNTELGTPQIGADGSSVLSITADRSAKMTIKLLQSSPFNQYLQNKVARQRSGALSGMSFPVTMVDLSTGETGACSQVMVMGEAMPSKGKNATERTWVLFCPCWEPGAVTVVGRG